MRNINLGGSWMDEFYKAAEEKGWVVKEGASLTPQQSSIVKSIMQLRKFDFNEALDYAKLKYPRLFSGEPVPKPAPKPAPVEKDPYEDMLSNLPKYEPVTVDIDEITEDALSKMRGKVPGQQPGDIAVEVTKPEPKPFVPKIPDWAKADDVTASVVNELISLATDLDNLGEEKAAIAIDQQTRLYVEAAEKLYDITGETGDDLINQAHPGGGPTLAPAAEEGGKIETIVEEHKKVVEKATKQPTGKYAETMAKLIVTANRLEDEGEIEAAKIVDRTIRELLESSPFVNRSTASEAADSEDFNASIIREAGVKELKSYIPLWDELVTKFYVIGDELANWSSVLEGLYPSSKRVRDAYRAAKRKIYDIATAWKAGNLDNASLSSEMHSLANILNVKDADGGIRSMFKLFGFRSGKIDRITTTHYQLISDFKRLSKKVAAGSTKTKQTAKPAKKKDAPRGDLTGLQQKRVQMYLSSLKMLESTILQNADKVHNVLANPDAIMKWIKDKKYNLTDPKSKFKYTPSGGDIAKIRSFVKTLQTKLAKTASLTSEAQGSAVPGGAFKDAPKPDKKPTPSKRRRPAVKSDPQVRKLQQAMMAAGIPLTRFKDDGKWGGETMKGWESLRKMVPRANLSPATKNFESLKPEFGRAIRFAQAMSKRVKRDSTKFKLYGGQFTLSDFDSVHNFLLSLDRNYKLNRKEVDDDPTYMRAVEAYIRKLYKGLQGSDGQYISNYYGPQTLRVVQSNFLKLVRQVVQAGLPSRKKDTDVPGLPASPGDKATKPSKLEAPTSRGGKPGSRDVGAKGLSYPQLTKPENITLAINLLPDSRWLSSVRNFTMKARASVREKGSPLRKLSPTQEGVAQQYWKLLDARVRDIITALGTFKAEITSRDPAVYRQMVDVITSFNNELAWIGEQMGFIK